MEENKQLVLNWIYTGTDFEKGVALFTAIGKNRNITTLLHRKNFRYADKLKYELCKSVGLDWKNLPVEIHSDPKEENQPVDSFVVEEQKANSSPGEEANQYPSIICRVIHEYGEAYRERGKVHFTLSGLPENNDPSIVEQRRDLLLQIKALSLRMEELHAAKSAWLNNKQLPDESKLWPVTKDSAVASNGDGPSGTSKQLPDDPAELRRLKKNLQTYNVKDNNLLQYQSVSTQPVRHPMPAGPRRLGIEKRMARRVKEIERIDLKLADYAG